MGEENPLFEFDQDDQVVKREFAKSCTGAAIATSAITFIDFKVIRMNKRLRELGFSKTFLLLQVTIFIFHNELKLLNIPVYTYFYFDITKQWTNVQRHLVQKYLVAGDELMYKPNNQF